MNRLRGRGGWVDRLIIREQGKPGAEDRGGVPVFSYSSGLPVAPEPVSRALGRSWSFGANFTSRRYPGLQALSGAIYIFHALSL